VVLGFTVLFRYPQNGPTFDIWNAICCGLRVNADTRQAREPRPPLQTPIRIAWTSATLARTASGNAQNCHSACKILTPIDRTTRHARRQIPIEPLHRPCFTHLDFVP
jgi:hypothetical protein